MLWLRAVQVFKFMVKVRNSIADAAEEMQVKHATNEIFFLPFTPVTRIIITNPISVFTSTPPSTARSWNSINVCLYRIDRALAGSSSSSVHQPRDQFCRLVLMSIIAHLLRAFGWLFMQSLYF